MECDALANGSYCMLFNGTTASGSPRLKRVTTTAPELASDDVIAKVLLATICGSDLHTFSGKRQEATPSILGHEAVAEVVQSRNSQYQVGERITFSIINSCTSCDLCHSGLPQKCSKLRKYGHMMFSEDNQLTGCYATHVLIRNGTAIERVPSTLPDGVVAPANCALATMVNALEQIQHRGSQIDGSSRTALVQGAGLLGVYGVALLKSKGYRTVYCTDTNKSRLDIVRRFGASPVLVENADSCSNAIPEASIDVVFEVCGQQRVLADGFRCLRVGGSYILVGLVHPDSSFPFTAEQVIRKCMHITGVHNYNSQHLKEAIQFLADTVKAYPYEELVSPPYALADLPAAIAVAHTQQYHRVSLRP